MPWHKKSAILFALLWLALLPRVGAAQEFRIETKIFSAAAEEPQSESLTLCRQGVIYDYLLTNSQEIAVFKTSAGEKAGRFILLDPERQVRCELSTDEILLFITDLKHGAAQQQDPLLRFVAEPQFTKVFDEETAELKLTSDLMTYRVKTQPAKDSAGMASYREYLDWYARLNAMIHVGSLPPGARLAVNAALAEKSVTAAEVELTIPARRGFQSGDLSLRAVHQLDWRLSKDDSQRIDQANRSLVEYKKVDFTEYIQPQQRVAAGR